MKNSLIEILDWFLRKIIWIPKKLKEHYEENKKRKNDYLTYWFRGLTNNEIELINQLINNEQHCLIFSDNANPIKIQGNGIQDSVSNTFYHWIEENFITIIKELQPITRDSFQVFYKYTLEFYPHPKKLKIIILKEN